jgi:Prolyl 4-Hydroxylase alpha-subunit, N-terminal region
MIVTRASSILLCFSTFVAAEVFSSISELVEILATEDFLIENLENYIHLERKRLDLLEEWVEVSEKLR